MSEIKGLYPKLLEIQKKILGLGKDKDGEMNKYKYVTGVKLLGFIKPMMNDLGILLKQEATGIVNTRQDYATKNGHKSEIHSSISLRFTWVDAETGEKDVNEFLANGQNGWDKGVGSALTYGERYFLLKYFHIPTDDDDIDNPESNKTQEPQIDLEALEVDLKSLKSLKDLTNFWNINKNKFMNSNESKALFSKYKAILTQEAV